MRQFAVYGFDRARKWRNEERILLSLISFTKGGLQEVLGKVDSYSGGHGCQQCEEN
jgi:hypothetical protein